MKEQVLVITGGLITSRETSVLHAARKWLTQVRHSQNVWLDVKVKTVIAEPLLAMRRHMRHLGTSVKNDIAEAYFASDFAPPEPPSLTEVVLTTLLHQAGMPSRALSLDQLLQDDVQNDQLLASSSCIFLSSTYLHDLSELEPIVRRIKRPHNRIVIGGALAGVIHPQWEGMPDVDVLAIGYGEMLVPCLVDWMRSGYEKLTPPEAGRIEDRQHSRFLYSGVPRTTSLDFLVTPDWKLTEAEHQQQYKTIYYESVRGCPYRCSFCNYPYLFDDKRFRYKSAEKMADDWQRYCDTMDIDYIVCLDSLFTMPRRRLKAFCELLVKRRINVKWICYARADDLADEETVVLMKAAGAHQVQIGVESGDQQQLQNMNKACTVEANQRALENCRRYGLTSVVSLIVGFPGETAASLERTYQFLKAAPPDFYFLATFSTRVAGVPVLQAESRRQFGLEAADNLFSMAPYWRHDTMSCADVGNHVRDLDLRIMNEKISLNATLFYQGMLGFQASQREALLDFQQEAVSSGPLTRAAFNALNAWIDRRLSKDVSSHFK